MGQLRRLVLIRHGETEGRSSLYLLGSSDVALSEEGRAQMRQIAGRLRGERCERVVASPLRRSFGAARLLAGDAPIRLEADFREIHFGRWEGLSPQEIKSRDPILHEDWQAGADRFEFPGGEKRDAFRERVRQGLGRLLAAPANDALVVVHKGVIRRIAAELLGEELGPDEPALGDILVLTLEPNGSWVRGQRSSNPPGVDAEIVTDAGVGSGA